MNPHRSQIPLKAAAFATVLITLGACASPGAGRSKTGAASSKESIPLAGKLSAVRFQLENGLRVVVVEDRSSPTLAYQTWFRVGSRDEKPGYTGLAHLFEHMMFKGTQSVPEGQFDKVLERAGAEGENAFTSRDYTAYIQEMPKDKLDLIASLEADRMKNLIVNEKSFSTEREVVQNERRFRNENSPDGMMYQELFGLAFKEHPYRWPVIGYAEDLARMKAEDAAEFYRSHYAPNNATIVVVGDVDPREVLSAVKKHYGNLSPSKTPETIAKMEPAQKSPRRKSLKLNIQVDKILLGYPIPAETHSDSPAISMLQTILSNGRSSRLHRALVDTGIASSVDSYDLDDKDPSLFIIGANLQKGRRTAEAEAVIRREIARLAREPVSAKEIERARNQMSFSLYEALDNNYQRASFIGRYETIAGGIERGLEIYNKALAVTPAEIQTVAARYLSDAKRNVIIGVRK